MIGKKYRLKKVEVEDSGGCEGCFYNSEDRCANKPKELRYICLDGDGSIWELEEVGVVDGEVYVQSPGEADAGDRSLCAGCAAYGTSSLCGRLPMTCTVDDVIWKLLTTEE